MFEKLITSFKKSLPESIRKILGIKIDDIQTKNDSEVIFDSFAKVGIKNASDENKKRSSMLVRVVLVIGLAYLAIDHFLLNGKPENEVITVIPRIRKPMLPKLASNKEEIHSKKDADVSEKKSEETIPPIENVNITNKKLEDNPVEEKSDSVSAEPVTKKVEGNKSEQVDKNIDKLIDSVDEKSKTKDETETKKEIKLEDKIVEDDDFIAPPSYDHLGRGLVYNCTDKHWACVDKSSYVNCNKNMKWNKSHEKPSQCAVINIYSSDEDCEIVQKHNVTTSNPTPFCI